jgi:RNA polymerase sigma factor (sigma-70 family)
VTLSGADFDELYRKYAPVAFRRARRLLRSDADAHDVVHDLFISLLERPEQYEGRSDLTGFMYKAASHACLNRLRNRKTRLRLLQQHAAPQDAEHAPTGLPEQVVALFSELEHMPESLALVAIYYHLDGLTHDEIAPLLGCSSRHVGNLVVRLSEWSTKERSA